MTRVRLDSQMQPKHHKAQPKKEHKRPLSLCLIELNGHLCGTLTQTRVKLCAALKEK